MKIALYTPEWPGGDTANGITTVNAILARGLADRGHDVSIITPKSTDAAGFPVFTLSPPRPYSLLEKLRLRLGHAELLIPIIADQWIEAAQMAIRETGAEVLLTEDTQGIAGTVQKALPIPVIVTLHGPWFLNGPVAPLASGQRINRGREEREADAFQCCAALTAPAADTLNRTVAYYGLEGKQHVVIPNPMPLAASLDYGDLSEREQRSLLFVGRFDTHKGGDLVLEGFARLIAGGDEAHLTFVGPDNGVPGLGGEGTLHIDAALAALPEKVRDRITYLGPRPKHEIAALRHRHVGAIVASRYENFGTVILEAMAHGTAIVATAVGGTPEMIEDGRNGLLVPPEDSEALAVACLRLLRDPGFAATLGVHARSDVADRFSPEAIAIRWEQFLGNVLDR